MVRLRSNWCKWWCEAVSGLPSGGEKWDALVLLLSRGADRVDETLLRFNSRSWKIKKAGRKKNLFFIVKKRINGGVWKKIVNRIEQKKNEMNTIEMYPCTYLNVTNNWPNSSSINFWCGISWCNSRTGSRICLVQNKKKLKKKRFKNWTSSFNLVFFLNFA